MYATQLEKTNLTEFTKFDNVAKAKRRLRYQPGLTLAREDAFGIETYGNISSFSRRERVGDIHLTVPTALLKDDDSYGVLTEYPSMLWPYGEYFRLKIGQAIFHRDWQKYSFGIIPGNYHFKNGDLFFDGILNPTSLRTSSILVFADASMISYAGEHGLITFNFGNTGLYGLILPFNYLIGEGRVFVDGSVESLCRIMNHGLNAYQAYIA